MKSHPILFSAPMVRALLARRKTQTRRLSEAWMKVKAGDELWVRETWAACHHGSYEGIKGPLTHSFSSPKYPWSFAVQYVADYPGGGDDDYKGMWRPSIHMPRWASRITLRATADARREPLQDISEADAIAEGIVFDGQHYWVEEAGYGVRHSSAVNAYAFLWDSLHGKDKPWAENPMVTVVSFALKPLEVK